MPRQPWTVPPCEPRSHPKQSSLSSYLLTSAMFRDDVKIAKPNTLKTSVNMLLKLTLCIYVVQTLNKIEGRAGAMISFDLIHNSTDFVSSSVLSFCVAAAA